MSRKRMNKFALAAIRLALATTLNQITGRVARRAEGKGRGRGKKTTKTRKSKQNKRSSAPNINTPKCSLAEKERAPMF